MSEGRPGVKTVPLRDSWRPSRWLAMTVASALAVWMVSAQPILAQQSVQSGAQGSGNLLRDSLNLDDNLGDRPAVLEADAISVDQATETVRATGDVRIYFGDRVLQADAVSYSQSEDRVVAEGNVLVINPDGSVVAAERAEFDSKLEDGLIEGAKAVLGDGQARLAAVEARRIDGTYNVLSKAVFSPCDVCADEPVPLWRIRARRVIQDETAKDIIYEDATFDLFGQPVLFLPYFRHADPTVERRTGFLAPSFFSSNNLGFSAKLPYYLELAPNRDLTVTPFVNTEENPVLEGEYRVLTETGQYTLGGSITHSNDPREEGLRGHFIGDGKFALASLDRLAPWGRDAPNSTGFKIGFDAQLASDDGYLRRYRYTNADRVEARGYVERFSLTGFESIETIRYQSFREDEFSGDIPLVLPQISFQRDLEPEIFGGTLDVMGDFLYLSRNGNSGITDVADTSITNGRDVLRLSSGLGWRRSFVTDGGIEVFGFSSLRGDLYRTSDDSRLDNNIEGRLLPIGGFEARYPLGLRTEGADHMLEPVGTLVIAPYGGNPDTIANEDSQDAELDELSIFSISRFPGLDRFEDGPRATLGLRYQRVPDQGPEIDVAVGQSFRLRDATAFNAGSGLREAQSDFVASWRVATAPHASLGHRFRVSPEGELRRNEVYAATNLNRFSLKGSYVFLQEDEAAGADEDREEGAVEASIKVTENWILLGNARRDFAESRFVTAGGGLRFANECCEVDFSVRRRFNEVDDVPASTDFGFRIRLKGLGSN